MKTVLTTGFTFAPAQKRVDFSAVPGFDARRLLAIIHGPTGRMIYAAATPALGYTALASGVLTLAFDTTTGMSASDALTVLYEADVFSPDNPAHVALDAQAAGLALENGGHLAAIDGKLPALVNGKLPVAIDGEGVVLTGPVTVANEVEIKNDSGNPIPVSGTVDVTSLPPGLALDASVQAAVTALATLHTDLSSNHADLAAIRTDTAATLHADLGALLTRLGQTLAISAAALPLPAGAATSAKQDAAVAAIVAALAPLATDADLQANTAKAEAIRALLAGTLNIAASALPLPAGAASETKLEAVRALLTAALTVNLPSGAATDASLQSILTVLQAQRAETLWTDDSGAFFVRVDTRGTITWTDPSGNASSAPGTGARPAAGTSAIVDATRYQATASGPGYSTGDYLSHIVTTDPQSGVVIGHFWLNVTTETKLSASPSAANISPIAALPAGAATAARQDTGNASLASLDGKAPALVSGRVPVDGSAVVQPVSATSLPLPSGAATAAKQPALGTAGSASLDVLTVQGIAGATALPISATALPLPSGAAQDGSDPASPAVANAGTGIRGWLATVAGQLAGTLKAQLQAGSATIGSVNVLGGNAAAVKTDGSATTQPVSGSVAVSNLPATQPISAASLPLPTGAAQDGTDGPGTNPGTGIRGWLSGIYARLGGTLTATLAAGANTIGAVTQAGTWAVNSTLQAGSAIVGRFGIDQTTPGTTNGVVVNSGTLAATTADGANVALGSKADTAALTGSVSTIALLKGIGAALIGATPASQAGPALGAAAALGVVQQDGLTFTLSGSAAGPLTNATYTTGWIPTNGYAGASIHLVNIGSGNTFSFEGSNDGTNAFPVTAQFANNVGGSPDIITATNAGGYKLSLVSAYIRVRISTYGTGTPTAVVAMKVSNVVPIATYASLGSLGGAATAANQSSEISALTTINTTLTAATPASQAGPGLGVTNALGVVQQDGKPYTVSATSAAPLVGTGTDPTTGAIPTDGYQSVSAQVTTAGTGNVVVLEESNDGLTWSINNQGLTKSNYGAASSTSLIPSSGGITFPLTMKYARFRVTTYGTGTPTIAATLRIANVAMPSTYVTIATQTGNYLLGATAGSVSASANGLTSVSRLVSAAATTNATLAKSTAGRAYKITGYNAAASIRWLKLYNKATVPVPGTDTPFFQLPLPPGAFSFDAQDIGYYFGTGIGYAITTGAADNDTTALTAGDILNLNVWYQ